MQVYKSLYELAQKYLNKKGVDDVQELLLLEKIEYTRGYIAGTLDVLWEQNKLQDKEVEDAFQKLGIEADVLISYSKQKVN